jgi:hypothetical protein
MLERLVHTSDGDAPAKPRVDTAAAKPRAGDTAASPKPLESPTTQGAKRTADGSVKTVGVALETPSTYRPMAAHKRNKSMDTHSGTRIGEVRSVAQAHVLTADATAAICPAQDASFLRHGQGPERLGETVT